MRRAAPFAILGMVAVATATPAQAQEMSRRVADRCVRAAVKVVALSESGGAIGSGSGSMIDARGYVLTNFHVVGHVDVRSGIPGTLINPRNRYRLATVDSDRDTARPRWIGAVVRASSRLDLALIRIISDTEGNPVRGSPFTTVTIADTRGIRPGTHVWAFGYPLGVRTINVTGGNITGFEMNARDQVAWMRSDAEFNPGNSGGMLVDARGRLVAVPTAVVSGRRTLEPIELARPTERIPDDWLQELRRGDIDDVRIEGVHRLRAGRPIDDAVFGDGGSLGGPEFVFYLLPRERPGVVRLSRELTVILATNRGRIIRRGSGSVEVRADDGDELLAALPFEDPGQDVHYQVRFEHTPPPDAVPPVVATTQVDPPDPQGPLADVPPDRRPPPGGRAVVRGAVVDAVTGRPVTGALVAFGRPGLDIRAHIQSFLQGRMTQDQLEAGLAGFARSDVSGRYEITGIPTNQSYPGAAAAPGYRPAYLRVTVADEGSVIQMNAIQLVR